MAQHVMDDDLRRFGRMLHYGGVLAAVLCATAAYSLLHAPTAAAIFETSTRIEEVLLSVQNAPLIREQHAKVSRTLADVERQIADVQARVPDDADAGQFLKEVTQIASEEHLAISNFQPDKPVSKPGYAELEVTLKGEGGFASICRFFDRLARLPRLSKVKAFTIAAAESGTAYPMTATLVIYFGLTESAGGGQEARRG